jgi:ABC-type multidrug transport system ATPase subunit
MYVRLGFAIAAYMEPEILLVDEILAVGDGKFQEKCYDHIAMLRDQGVTIVMVSHDLNAVERFSTRAALMERGRMVAIGSPKEIVALHVDRLATTSPEIRAAIGEAMEASGHEAIQQLLDTRPEVRERFAAQLDSVPGFHEALAEKLARERSGEGDSQE